MRHKGEAGKGGRETVTTYQRAKRVYLWRGSAIVLTGATFVMLASSYCSQLTQ
jgi:hypothetical protein